MDRLLAMDTAKEAALLEQVLDQAKDFLNSRGERFVAPRHPRQAPAPLAEEGLGAQGALDLFREVYEDHMLASSGPRYFGFVIGGVTPAALAGDWLTSLYDQNAFGYPENVDRDIEDQVVDAIRQLLNLKEGWFGSLCSGGTMANFVGLATARQWIGRQLGVPVSEEGLMALDKVNLVGGCTHASTYKAISMLGMGRKNLTAIPCYPGREAVNLELLEEYLQTKKGQPVVVIANLGTANSGDYDDMAAIARLKEKYGFYLHVDASIIGIAACSPQYAPIFEGLEQADSISVDAHKWLNTTYDAALQLTKHPDLQYQAFAQSASAPGAMPADSPLFNFTPEGSRRFRALPLWFSLMAYGRSGYRQLVESNCSLAQELGARMAATPYFRLMNDVRLNIVCYTLKVDNPTGELINRFAARLREKGVTYSNTTVYNGVPAIRICLSNYLTTKEDVDLAYDSILETAREFLPGRE
ncbi:MAG TPA: aspartate aminotransferase family protein [Firmicutes bacterium]|nr:aspartate aminotransferase family protein [Bacillota bacterium]